MYRVSVMIALTVLIGCASDDSKSSGEDGTTTETITSEGGNILVGDGEVTITIPKGAVEKDTEITVKKVTFGDGSPQMVDIDDNTQIEILGYGLEFNPEGLKFQKPIVVEMELEEPILSKAFARVVTSNKNAKEWTYAVFESEVGDVVGVTSENGATVNFSVDHFSIYTIQIPMFPLHGNFRADYTDDGHLFYVPSGIYNNSWNAALSDDVLRKKAYQKALTVMLADDSLKQIAALETLGRNYDDWLSAMATIVNEADFTAGFIKVLHLWYSETLPVFNIPGGHVAGEIASTSNAIKFIDWFGYFSAGMDLIGCYRDGDLRSFVMYMLNSDLMRLRLEVLKEQMVENVPLPDVDPALLAAFAQLEDDIQSDVEIMNESARNSFFLDQSTVRCAMEPLTLKLALPIIAKVALLSSSTTFVAGATFAMLWSFVEEDIFEARENAANLGAIVTLLNILRKEGSVWNTRVDMRNGIIQFDLDDSIQVGEYESRPQLRLLSYLAGLYGTAMLAKRAVDRGDQARFTRFINLGADWLTDRDDVSDRLDEVMEAYKEAHDLLASNLDVSDPNIEAPVCPDDKDCSNIECGPDIICGLSCGSCETPPDQSCSSDHQLTIYDTPGECRQGRCQFVETTETCQYGCDDEAQACRVCHHECDTDGFFCVERDGSSFSEICATDNHGCRVFSIRECENGCEDGFCISCDDQCSPEGRTDCDEGEVRTCENDAGGCLIWSDPTPCSDGFCGDDTSCGNCDHQCPEVGVSCNQDGLTLETCTADDNGCRTLTTETCDNGCDQAACLPPAVMRAQVLSPGPCEIIPSEEQPVLQFRITDLTGIDSITIDLQETSGCYVDASDGSVEGYPIIEAAENSITHDLTGLIQDTWYKYRIQSTASDGIQSSFIEGWFFLCANAGNEQWLDEVIEFYQPEGSNMGANNPSSALGPDNDGYVAIDIPETLTVAFTDNIAFNGPGNDLRIREYGGDHAEANVYGSQDGTNWTFLVRAKGSPIPGSGNYTNIYIDIDSYGLSYVRFLRFEGLDNLGTAAGFDLDAVEALHSCNLNDYEEPELNPIVEVIPVVDYQGSTFHQPGTGFTPNGEVWLYFRYPNSEVSEPIIKEADENGDYQHYWNSPTDVQVGMYEYWALDWTTHTQSNVFSFQVLDNSVLICDDQCSYVGESTCSDGLLETCYLDSDGCLVWSDPVPCDEGFCADETSCARPTTPSIDTMTVAEETLSLDVVSDTDDGIGSDGVYDGVFDVTLTGPIAELVLVTTDMSGNPVDRQQWDSIIENEEIPNEITAGFGVGWQTWVLGVEEDGLLINYGDGSIPEIPSGTHHIKVYGTDTGYFKPGNFFQLIGVLEDGQLVHGPVIHYNSQVITNASFEYDTPEQGGWLDSDGGSGVNSAGYITGWDLPGGWGGTFQPTAIPYPAGIPDGNNIAWINGSYCSQVLSETVAEGYSYILQVYVGNRADIGFQGYSVQLRAGENLLAEDSSLSPLPGQFILSTVEYSALPGDSNIGLPLEIRLVSNGIQVNFDDVSLEVIPQLPSPNMALIPYGCFDMGDAFNEWDASERPVHNVCITSDFYMDVHEVTNAEYAACVSAGVCAAPSTSSSYTRTSYFGNPIYDDFPVIYVDWNQANDYCSWAGKRLPTEAEWEYAARGGLSGNRYPWGDTIIGTDANYLNSGDPWDNDTSPVEYYAPNGYGLYDMAGNVSEWVNDWHQFDYYSVSPTNDPPGPTSGTNRVLRGGGWDLGTTNMRVSYRPSNLPTMVYRTFGFRCADD